MNCKIIEYGNTSYNIVVNAFSVFPVLKAINQNFITFAPSKQLKMNNKSGEINVKLIYTLTICVLVYWFLYKGFFNISYWVYYKPLYAVFGNSLYLPLCLYVTARLPLIIFCSLIVKITKRWYKLISVAFLCVLFWAAYYNVAKDMAFISREKYKILECEISTVHKWYWKNRAGTSNSSKRAPSYTIRKTQDLNDMDNFVEMNVYQYETLLPLKEQYRNNKEAKIVVYYLPNTKLMLKYELPDK